MSVDKTSTLLLASAAHRTLATWLDEDVKRGHERARWLAENHEALALAERATEADALERRMDVICEAVMRLRPALRNGQIEEAVTALVEVVRAPL